MCLRFSNLAVRVSSWISTTFISFFSSPCRLPQALAYATNGASSFRRQRGKQNKTKQKKVRGSFGPFKTRGRTFCCATEKQIKATTTPGRSHEPFKQELGPAQIVRETKNVKKKRKRIRRFMPKAFLFVAESLTVGALFSLLFFFLLPPISPSPEKTRLRKARRHRSALYWCTSARGRTYTQTLV